MKKFNKLIFSLLFITTQLIYGSAELIDIPLPDLTEETTAVHSINSNGESVTTRIYTNLSHSIHRSVETNLLSGERRTTTEYQDGSIFEVCQNITGIFYRSTLGTSSIISAHVGALTRRDATQLVSMPQSSQNISEEEQTRRTVAELPLNINHAHNRRRR